MTKRTFSSFGFTTQQAEAAVNWLGSILAFIVFAIALWIGL